MTDAPVTPPEQSKGRPNEDFNLLGSIVEQFGKDYSPDNKTKCIEEIRRLIPGLYLTINEQSSHLPFIQNELDTCKCVSFQIIDYKSILYSHG